MKLDWKIKDKISWEVAVNNWDLEEHMLEKLEHGHWLLNENKTVQIIIKDKNFLILKELVVFNEN